MAGVRVKKLLTDEVLDRIRDGADVRLEREDAFVVNLKTGAGREIVGVRVYLRSDPTLLGEGRYVKTSLWLCRDPKHDDRPATFAGVLGDLALVINGPEPVEVA